MRGYNQGRVGILELINKLRPDVIMVQEHWLTPDNLHKLDNISTDYFIFGSSAMNERVCSGPLYGRPFGGTAMLINKCHTSSTHSLGSSDRFTAIKISNSLLITVYFPCVGTPQREFICTDLLSELDALISANPNCKYLIAGDFNTNLDSNVAVSLQINEFISNNNFHRCDVISPVSNKFTYFNETAGCSTTIFAY